MTRPSRDVAIRRRRVESSNLASVGYSPTTRTLEVRFRPRRGRGKAPATGHGGAIYRYGGIERPTVRAILEAGSLGRAFNDLVITQPYEYERLR